jgi:hypothetical protein
MTLLFLLVFSSYHTKKSNMGESSLFTGQPIFNQLLFLIPRGEPNRLGCKYQADRYGKSFRTYDRCSLLTVYRSLALPSAHSVFPFLAVWFFMHNFNPV